MRTNEENQNSDVIREIGRIVVGGYYDYQGLRLSTMNRIRDVIRKVDQGIPFDAVEEKKEKDKKSRGAYSDDLLPEILERMKAEGKVKGLEYTYIKNSIEALREVAKLENRYKRQMTTYLQGVKVYVEFLSKIRGIGPTLASNLIKEFGEDCARYDTVSKLWKHSGNHVIDGRAERKHKDMSFSPRLRTMTWKISDCLMKANHGLYRELYDSSKVTELAKRYEPGVLYNKYKDWYSSDKTNPYKPEDTSLRLMHAHNRALRRARKVFLAHFWAAARELNGLDTRLPYVQEKLGHIHIITWHQAVNREALKKVKGVSEEPVPFEGVDTSEAGAAS